MLGGTGGLRGLKNRWIGIFLVVVRGFCVVSAVQRFVSRVDDLRERVVLLREMG